MEGIYFKYYKKKFFSILFSKLHIVVEKEKEENEEMEYDEIETQTDNFFF